MEKYEYGLDGKCRYELYCSSCRNCLFETLCRLEKDQGKATPDQEKISEKF